MPFTLPPSAPLQKHYLYLCLPLLTCLFAFIIWKRRPVHNRKAVAHSKTVQILKYVFTPSSVAWEHDYVNLYKFTECKASSTIQLSLCSLLSTVCGGSVEIRDMLDLPKLLSGRLCISGWNVILDINFSYCIRVMKRLFLVKTFGAQYRVPVPDSIPHYLIPSGHLTGFFDEDQPPRKGITYDLDIVPYCHLETAIRSIKCPQGPTSAIVFEFTTIAAHVPHFSTTYLLCTVPYVGCGFEKRAITPLHLTLHRFVEIVSSSSIFTLYSICDISRVHASLLELAGRRLVDDQTARTSYIRRHSTDAWRRKRLSLAWEAALLANGYMVRWQALCIPRNQKNDHPMY